MNKKPRIKVLRPGLRVLDTRTVSPMEKDVDKLYASAAWRHLVDQIIQERGQRCEDPTCRTPNGPWGQIYADHIKEVRDGGEKLDKRNVMLRCAPCHGRKTAQERAKRAAATHQAE